MFAFQKNIRISNEYYYSLRPKLYVTLEKEFVSNCMSLYNTNETLMLLFLLYL